MKQTVSPTTTQSPDFLLKFARDTMCKDFGNGVRQSTNRLHPRLVCRLASRHHYQGRRPVM